MSRKKRVIRSDFNTRIKFISIIKVANMIYNGEVIGQIVEEKNDCGEKDWVIKPDWEMLDKYGKEGVVIDGIDYDLRLDEYIRTELPEFINIRSYPDNRVGLYEELEAVGLNYNDRFEFMCRTHGNAGVDPVRVEFVECYRIQDGQKVPLD